jgi:tetratricopeptide (TPR) repeat protein
VPDELERYIAKHEKNRRALEDAAIFLMRYDRKLPRDRTDKLITVLDALVNARNGKNFAHMYRENLVYLRAAEQTDVLQRLTDLNAFMAKYPDSSISMAAQFAIFHTYVELKDVEHAEAAMATYENMQRKDPHGTGVMMYGLSISLANLYLDKDLDPNKAMKVADKAEATITGPHAALFARSPEYKSHVEGTCAAVRARAYLAMHKPAEAIGEATKAVNDDASIPQYRRIRAHAYAAIGDKHKALDDYFEAALLPSNQDADFRNELESYYLKQGFGDRNKFTAELERRRKIRFEAANYVPTLLHRDAPRLAFTTDKGEKFDATALNKKTVVMNFWAPT